MDERERAERYRRAVIRPYICAGRTIFLLKATSSSLRFPLSDVAFSCGASVERDRQKSRLFFNYLIPFLSSVPFPPLPFFVSCIC